MVDYIDNRDRLALLLSAIGHDLNHPGVSNFYLVNSRHNLAIRYNDISVLENYHAATLIQLLETDGLDFWEVLPIEDSNYLRK